MKQCRDALRLNSMGCANSLPLASCQHMEPLWASKGLETYALWPTCWGEQNTHIVPKA